MDENPQLPPNPEDGLQPQPAAPKPTNERRLDEIELKSARTLSTVATVAGPVSLIIGGVALSTVSLVCGILALSKVRKVIAASPEPVPVARALRQTAVMGIVIGAVALVLNAVSVALMMPVLLEAMQTGDYSAILGDAAGNLQGPSPDGGSSGGSAWG